MVAGKAVILQPCLRTGIAGQVVDNAASGGILAVIDEESGEVLTDGYDEAEHVFTEHPDSHKPFRGQRIPHWNELMELVQEIHALMPAAHKYIGFDFALNDEGKWCLIEGNWGQFIGQFAGRLPIRRQFEELMTS